MRISVEILTVGVVALTLAGSAAAQSSVSERCEAMPTRSETSACLAGAQAVIDALRRGETPSGAIVTPSQPAVRAPAPVDGAGAAVGVTLGEDQVRARNGDFQAAAADDAVVTARIVAMRQHQPGQWDFELDNGQVWRQISGDTQDVRMDVAERPAVEMWSSWSGGYRMRLVSERQQIKVERLR